MRDLASAKRSGGSIEAAAGDESSFARSRGSACAALEEGKLGATAARKAAMSPSSRCGLVGRRAKMSRQAE